MATNNNTSTASKTLASPSITVYYSGHARDGEWKDKLVDLNASEETGMKNYFEECLKQGEITKEQVIQDCEAFMQLYQPGQRVFPVLPAYIKELKASMEPATNLNQDASTN